MKTLERLVAEKLLKIKAVKLQPANPFTWASGWRSPIYNDNRKTLSYPAVRSFIKLELARVISEKYENADAIAGVATGAIAQGALVADLLGLPFVYIRATPKDHGLENLIEGELKPGSKVVIIEDLVSTGGSSLKAVQAVRNFGCYLYIWIPCCCRSIQRCKSTVDNLEQLRCSPGRSRTHGLYRRIRNFNPPRMA